MTSNNTTCCIVGGGPAGVMLGYLLARAGVEVTVLEKHKDFFRDFRGDTVHPSTMQLMKELGILEEFLRQPHQQVDTVRAVFGGQTFELASLKKLRIDTPFIALMPQWDFLNFLSGKAKAYSEFSLLMEHEAVNLLRNGSRIQGVVVRTPDGEKRIEADLVIACDGRHSIMRQQAALPVKDYGAPIDVLWFRISRAENDPVKQVMGNINYGKLLILLDRGNYFQAGLIIEKGSFERIQQEGIAAFRRSITEMVPQLGNRADEIETWDQVKLLSVQVNRLRQWGRPGLLCVGDAAHAMSPVFGVGINLAIQDAVAAANQLAVPLRNGENTDAILGRVQKRREFPTVGTQQMQVMVHRALRWVFRQRGPMKPPWLLREGVRIPGLQTFVARTVGMGLRPEHVRTEDIHVVQLQA
jgi:2-polyprenyl-6-methoxyphenol hydroxylase-like FAD-dependent oxidoreductase